MQQAMDLLPTAPREATSLAMRALAVQLLLTTQVRLRNLIEMKVGTSLQSYDPSRRRSQRLDIAAQSTKNRNAITRPISPATRAMLDIWVRHFRPTLATDADGYLFPGHGRPHIGRQGMRDAVKGIVRQVTGIALGPHDFRGLVAKIHLHFNPGDYGTVMHLLGHTELKTTMDSYTADEAERAAEDFDRTVLRLTRGELSLTRQPGRRESRKPRSPLLPPGGKPRGPWGRS
jgi:integrase